MAISVRHRLLLFPTLCLAVASAAIPHGFAAEPVPLPYVAAPFLKPLAFEQPLAMVIPPGETNRLFIIEKKGRIVVVPDLAKPTREVFLDISDRLGTNSDGELGLLALAFHPQYRTNRQFYVWYTQFTGSGKTAHGTSRLARFQASATNPNAADPASEQLLIVQPDEASNHNGGELLFGPDGYLYLSIGDEGAGNDKFENSQRITKDFFAGILRLDVDRRPGNLAPNSHPAVQPGTYSVPRDNPFVGATNFNNEPVEPSAVRTEFWAVGLRNVWRMSFDSATGQLWAADVGQNSSEEIDLIVRGGNYGWNYREASGRGPRKAPEGLTFVEPIWDYPRTEGISVTGGFVYHGTRYPDLEGQYLFADYVMGRLWALRPDGDRRVSADRVRQIAQVATITSFGLDPRTGEILLASFTQGLLRLAPATSQ
ncbi:MAG: PQQ-dependent sugar dehydrogenase [Verrucomicrobiota bacterium]